MKVVMIFLCVFCAAFLSKAQTIKQAEYFIDKDKGVGKNTRINLPASADSSYSLSIDLAGVSPGIHKLYIRTKDSNEKWSVTSRKNLLVVSSFDQPSIISGEYFIDKDPGYGKANAISVSEGNDIAQNFSFLTADLKLGYHKLYSRYKDSLGNWSLTTRRNIEIIKTADTIKIVEIEYLFASDKGYDKNFTRASPDTVVDGKFRFKIPYNKINDSNILFVRVKDSLGNWSLTKLDTFTIQSFAKTLVNAESRMNNLDAKLLSVYPNPATKYITLNYPLQNKTVPVTITDINGKHVLQQTMQSGNQKINISKFAPGTYLLQLTDGDDVRSAKFIKQ